MIEKRKMLILMPSLCRRLPSLFSINCMIALSPCVLVDGPAATACDFS
jgi:hypothetical protein